MARHRTLCLLLALLFLPAGVTCAEPVRIGLTPVFLDNQTSFIEQWRSHLERKLQRPVQFYQRSSYRGILELLQQGELDFAWLCGYPYVRQPESFDLVAVPIYQGQPLYRSYLIVPADDETTRSLADLRDKVFAYSDPDSNSGYLFTQYQLLDLTETRQAFFRRTFFTWAHRKVVEAVAAGVADGGAVDGYVWDTLAQLHPELTGRTRVVERSEPFGFPPMVARARLPQSTFSAMERALLEMSADDAGMRLLERLNLDGFAPGDPSLYDSIGRMKRRVGERGRVSQP